MTWATIVDLIRDEAGHDLGERIIRRLVMELRGTRITVGARCALTAAAVDAAAPGKPKEAARRLGVDVSTVYRAVWRSRIIR
jgi:transcriptional regulator of acetoin/glycerol metabolism